ncbi:hypothetical protein ACIRPK_26545 [Kitasatospora sp. NPDC101801]|uniref:hypothetical protein n=1 Tax=Kitasatospora sp. NPDC101801 TaxID=3364103 RepID=UPI0037FE2742
MPASPADRQPVIACTVTVDTPPDQLQDTVFYLAEAQLPLTVEMNGSTVRYHPLTDAVRPRPIGAGDAAVLDAYGELPSVTLLMRAGATAFHHWQSAVAGAPSSSGHRPDPCPEELERAWVLAQAVMLDISSLRDGGDPRTAQECVDVVNHLRALEGLGPVSEREAVTWLRYIYASQRLEGGRS